MTAYIDEHRGRFGVQLICQTLDVSASAYYHRAATGPSLRAMEDERLLDVITLLHERNYHAYGYRKMWKALRRAGEGAGRDQVKRVMRQNGVQGAKRRGRPWRTTIADQAAQPRSDLVERNFTAVGPDRLYVADFTYLRTWRGVVFFSFVIDVYSRRIVGWQFASHMRASLVCDALKMALATRPRGADVKRVHHSDRGSQYTSDDFAQVIDDHDVLASVGSVGDAYDKALVS